MRCFVTGGTGFVGGRLCQQLRADGHEVIAIARAGSDASLLSESGCKIIEGSIDSMNAFARHAESIDVFFHLAAITKAVRRQEFIDVNCIGTRKVLAGLARGGFLGKFVLLSSLAAGGPARDGNTPRREGDDDTPVSDYGKSKLAAEKVLIKRLPRGATFTILRPGAIYGPREHEMLEVFRMMSKTGLAFQIGPPVLVQMTHVDDIVDGLIRVASTSSTNGRVYYQNDETVWSFPNIVHLVSEILGRNIRTVRLPLVAGKVIAGTLDAIGQLRGKPISPFGRDKLREMARMYWLADSTRLENDTGWSARRALPDGLRETIDWYRENGWL